MNILFTERNNMRERQSKTDHISKERYELLLSVCNRYVQYLASKFPQYCYDNATQNCGVDIHSLKNYMSFRIPGLVFDYQEMVVVPGGNDYNQFALLDYIEFIGQNIKDIQFQDYHSYFQHQHIKTLDSANVFNVFRREINDAFSLSSLLYTLTESKQVVRITDADAQISQNAKVINTISEPGLQKLIEESLQLYMNPRPEIYHTAIEKIWDALERIKTIGTASGLDKKASATVLIQKMSNGHQEYIDLFNAEFIALTNIGNNYRIRHHEVGKHDITDERYYGYFFNRCFALVCLALNYI